MQRFHNLSCMYSYNDDVTFDNAIFKSETYIYLDQDFGVRLEYRCTNGSITIPEYTYVNTTNITISLNETVQQDAANLREKQAKSKHETLIKENVAVGLMFASKSIMQMVINPFVGPLTNR